MWMWWSQGGVSGQKYLAWVQIPELTHKARCGRVLAFVIPLLLAGNCWESCCPVCRWWPQKIFFFKDFMSGAREMAQQLRVLAAFVRDPGLVPSTHLIVHNRLSLQFQGVWLSLMSFKGTTQMCYRHIYSQNTHIENKNKSIS